MLSFPQIKLALFGVTVLTFVSLGGYCFYIKWKLAECVKAPFIETVKAEVKHDKVQRKVMSLDDASLHAAYCQWVRDNKTKCLQADIPIRE